MSAAGHNNHHFYGARMKYFTLLALLFTNAAFANGLDDLRGALGQLQGQGTLHGTFEARSQKTETGKGKAPEVASATAYVEEDANGFSTRWDRAVLKRA